nr:unnamed protein product [Callosobruchus chinensis]
MSGRYPIGSPKEDQEEPVHEDVQLLQVQSEIEEESRAERHPVVVRCFPDISLNPLPTNTHKLSCDIAGASRRTSVAAVAVVDESTVAERLDGPAKAWVVKLNGSGLQCRRRSVWERRSICLMICRSGVVAQR